MSKAKSDNSKKPSNYKMLYAKGRKALERRVSGYRFLHSLSVADTAADLARVYNIDIDKARLAGMLHDWDKDFTDDELIRRAEKNGVAISDYQEDMAALLHSQTGAIAVSKKYPEISDDVIQAISRHTAAAPDMTELDMIIYIADMIEPLRTRGNLRRIRAAVGKISLEELFVKAYETTMANLIARHRFIHPDSLEVWNAYIHHERADADAGPHKGKQQKG